MSELPTIAGYRFGELLGRGGMAAVYSAVQISLGRDVAIKVVAPDSDNALQRLENEARSLAELNHPHIVQLFDFGRTEQGAMYYVMPLLGGGDLTRWEKPVNEERLRPLLNQLLDALAHAHAADIVHRDIKPENILFDRDGRPLLADFGAAQTRRPSRLTATGTTIGSSGYMSPEQARGMPVDARSDLYSLAVLAYELLTAQRPFAGADDLAVALAQLQQPVPKLPVPLAHWQGFFDRALAADPQQRFATAAQMRDAVNALAVRTKPATTGPRTRVWVIGLLALVVVLAFGLGLWRSRRVAVSPEAIAQLISSGALTSPDTPNALDQWLLARAQGVPPATLEPLRSDLLRRSSEPVRQALQREEPASLVPAWRRWRQVVSALGAAGQADVVELTGQAEALVAARLEQAVATLEQEAAVDALALVDAWPNAPATVQSLAQAVRGLPALGERFRDGDGPELVLASKPVDGQPGLALMTTPLQPAFYALFAPDSSRASTTCESNDPAIQTCVDWAGARALADWLSRRTGERYRLPSQRELVELKPQITPVAVLAWSSTCHEVRSVRQENVVRRTWGEVRSLFGRDRPAARGEVRCDGYLALPLDERSEAQVVQGARNDTSVLLVREIGGRKP